MRARAFSALAAALLPAVLPGGSFAAGAAAAELVCHGGLFYFHATDYYYPNFYDEAGFRAEAEYMPARAPVRVRLQLYGYPGDDNVFESILEFDYVLALRPGRWELALAPQVGLGMTKLQYRVPYYPERTYRMLFCRRGGGEASVGYARGPVSARAAYRFRALYYPGSSYGALLRTGTGSRYYPLYVPFGEVAYDLSGAWRLSGRGGCEFGGYYDAVFMNKEKKARPYGELGFGYSW
jgi:hypothetical protein